MIVEIKMDANLHEPPREPLGKIMLGRGLNS